jgi:hypothetical protein
LIDRKERKADQSANSEPFDFAKYRRPQFEEPLRRAGAEGDHDQIADRKSQRLAGPGIKKIRRVKSIVLLVSLDGCEESSRLIANAFNARLKNMRH